MYKTIELWHAPLPTGKQNFHTHVMYCVRPSGTKWDQASPSETMCTVGHDSILLDSHRFRFSIQIICSPCMVTVTNERTLTVTAHSRNHTWFYIRLLAPCVCTSGPGAEQVLLETDNPNAAGRERHVVWLCPRVHNGIGCTLAKLWKNVASRSSELVHQTNHQSHHDHH